MSKQYKIRIDCCGQCPFMYKDSHPYLGGVSTDCEHEKAPTESAVDIYKSPPTWCPLENYVEKKEQADE